MHLVYCFTTGKTGASDLEQSHVEGEFKEGEQWKVQVAIKLVQSLSSEQTRQKERVDGYRDDLYSKRDANTPANGDSMKYVLHTYIRLLCFAVRAQTVQQWNDVSKIK